MRIVKPPGMGFRELSLELEKIRVLVCNYFTLSASILLGVGIPVYEPAGALLSTSQHDIDGEMR